MEGKGAVEGRVDGEDAAIGEKLIGGDDGLSAPGREGELEIVIVAGAGVVCEACAGGGSKRVRRWAFLHSAFWGFRSVHEVRGIYLGQVETVTCGGVQTIHSDHVCA